MVLAEEANKELAHRVQRTDFWQGNFDRWIAS
jgi:hypothetical protein